MPSTKKDQTTVNLSIPKKQHASSKVTKNIVNPSSDTLEDSTPISDHHITSVDVDSDGEDTSSVYSKSTLFVSTLPFTAKADDLEEFFSQIGPVRSCFIAKQKLTGLSSGCGYVHFALAEDAQRALVELKKQKFMGGRTLKMKIALRKSIVVQRKSEGIPVNIEEVAEMEKQASKDFVKMKRKLKVVDTTPVSSTSAVINGPLANAKKSDSTGSKLASNMTTLLLSRLPAKLTKKQLYKKLRKFGDVEDLQFPIDDVMDAASQDCARVIYKNEDSARRAQKQLNEHQFKGATIKSVIEPTKAKQRARLIIRNLSFNCKPENLQNVFSAFGIVKDCSVPHLDDGKARGFGFVEFETMDCAQRALQAVNGTKILNRPVAVDWALAKATFDRLSALPTAEGEDSSDNEDQVADAAQHDNEMTTSLKPQNSLHESMMEVDGEDGMEITMDDESSEEDDGIEIIMDNEVDSDVDQSSTRNTIPDESKPSSNKASSSQDDADTTLFIRNLSFETTEKELYNAFSTFGKLRYAKITMDKTSGLSRGTGFVCFYDEKNTSDCLVEYEKAKSVALLVMDPTSSNAVPVLPTSRNEYTTVNTSNSHKSVITPELSQMASGTNPAFMLGGRMLSITIAVSKKLAGELTYDSKLRRRAQDKRNMYLMREGVIFAGTEAAKTITEEELLKRTNSFADRKRILATNPNLFISRTRLSIRSLMPYVTDHELRNTAKHAVIAFWKQVEEGTRQPLEPEVVDEELQQGNDAPGIKRKVTIRQAKVLLDMDRLDAVTKKPKSKGYGFVEFNSHADALACLRWLNNNPTAFIQKKPQTNNAQKADSTQDKKTDKQVKAMPVSNTKVAKRPIVEFAVENRLVLKQRGERDIINKAKNPESTKVEGAAARIAKKDQIKKRKRDTPTADEPSQLPKTKKPDIKSIVSKTKAGKTRVDGSQSVSSLPKRPRALNAASGLPALAETEKSISKKQAKRARQDKEETDFTSMVARYRSQINAPLSKNGDGTPHPRSISSWTE
ncbi:RNA recognition motif-containing protein [Batrachochytrium dendrobatidis]|nr:RNA recognition motif-containing protein [Batrachochytrium dendrobatidis]